MHMRSGTLHRMEKTRDPKKVLAAETRWRTAIHTGSIDLVNIKIPCFVLDDRRRMVSNGGMMSSLDMSRGGAGLTSHGNDRLLRFARGARIGRYLSEAT